MKSVEQAFQRGIAPFATYQEAEVYFNNLLDKPEEVPNLDPGPDPEPEPEPEAEPNMEGPQPRFTPISKIKYD